MSEKNIARTRKNHSGLRNNRGVALVMALIVTLVVFLMIGGIWYVITQSTLMTGAGKRYATAEEAADGAINLIRDSISQAMYGQSVASIFPGGGSCTEGGTMTNAILTNNQKCTTPRFSLLSTGGSNYMATVTVERLYSMSIAGGRIEFARGGGVGSTAIFYRITTIVVGPNNATAENSVLYRFVG